MENGSRVTQARRRLRTARRSIGVAAGIAFAGIALAARAAHPGTSHQATSSSGTATQSAATSDDGFFDDGGATFSQSQSSGAQVQSGGS